jgi:hypothetical protein
LRIAILFTEILYIHYASRKQLIFPFYIQIEEKDHFLNLKASECNGSLRKDRGATKNCDYTTGNDQYVFSQVNRHVDFWSNVVSISILD